jgi:hypothetical protein
LRFHIRRYGVAAGYFLHIFRLLFPAVKPEYVLFEWFVIIRG